MMAFNTDPDKKYEFQCLEKQTKGTTSEKYKTKSKQFVFNVNDITLPIKKQTYDIIKNYSDFTLPEIGEIKRVRTQAQLDNIGLVLKIVQEKGVIDELLISTYTLNANNFKIIQKLVETGKIKYLFLLLASSLSFRSKHLYERYSSEVLAMSKSCDVHLVFAWSHFKITLFRFGNTYLQVEGSANYSTNNMAEQFSITNSKELFEFDKAFMLSALKSKNKALDIVC